MRSRPAHALPYLLAFVLGAGAAVLAACGAKTNPAMIPASSADQLKSDLDSVLSAIDSRDCSASARAVRQVNSDLLELPSGTSKRLQLRLKDGVGKLTDQAAKECQDTTTTETTTTTTVPTTTTTVPPPPTTTTPPTTPTTPTTTTPTTTTPTTTPTSPGVVTAPNDTGGAGAP